MSSRARNFRDASLRAEREAGLVFYRGRLLPGYFEYERWRSPDFVWRAGLDPLWLCRDGRGHALRVDRENGAMDAVGALL